MYGMKELLVIDLQNLSRSFSEMSNYDAVLLYNTSSICTSIQAKNCVLEGAFPGTDFTLIGRSELEKMHTMYFQNQDPCK